MALNRSSSIIGCAVLSLMLGLAEPAIAQSSGGGSATDQVVTQLQQQGFNVLGARRTLLGRVRVLAQRGNQMRELVFDPRNGAILRDYAWAGDSEGGGVQADTGSLVGGASSGSDGDTPPNGGTGSNSGGGSAPEGGSGSLRPEDFPFDLDGDFGEQIHDILDGNSPFEGGSGIPGHSGSSGPSVGSGNGSNDPFGGGSFGGGSSSSASSGSSGGSGPSGGSSGGIGGGFGGSGGGFGGFSDW